MSSTSSSSDSSYNIHRLTADNLDALQYIYKDAFGKEISLSELHKKQDTSAFGPSFVGYIAYSEENEPAAFYGVFPCLLSYNGKQYLGAQSGDTMTHSNHRGKGLFTLLAKKTYELCRELGVDLVFGFPNENSYPGFVRKLDWEHVNDMVPYIIRVRTLSYARIKQIIGLSAVSHLKWCDFVLNQCKPGKAFDSSVLESNKGGILRNQDFFAYKTYENNRIIEVSGIQVWVKTNHDFLIIGDIEKCSDKKFLEVIKRLKRMAFIMGLHHLRFQCTSGAFHEKHFASISKKLDVKYPVGGVNFTNRFPLSHLHFTTSDNDGF
ncbi:GNAT family N-acetyltransferase [Bacteroidota bacterium]